MIDVGDIVQVDPAKETFGCCLVVVTEAKPWGVQGYVQNAGQPGQAYIRLRHGEFELTGGRVAWIAQ